MNEKPEALYITLPREVVEQAWWHIEWFIDNRRGGLPGVRDASAALLKALNAPSLSSPPENEALQREPSGNFDNGGAVLLLQSKDAKLRHQHAEIERLMKEVVSLTATRDRQALMLRRLEEREAELDAEIGRLTKAALRREET